MPDATSLHHCLQNHNQYCTILSLIQALNTNRPVASIAEGGWYSNMPSLFYIASVVLLQLHGCLVSHMLVLATPLISVHNIKHSFCWILTT